MKENSLYKLGGIVPFSWVFRIWSWALLVPCFRPT